MKLSLANPVIIDLDPFSTNVVQQADLGTIIETSDFRRFRYAISGASALTGGNIATEPVSKPNHFGITPSAAVNTGLNSVSVTLGATAAVLNEYAEGWLAVSGNAGTGQVYKISYSPAIVSSGTGLINLYDNVSTALTTASLVNLIHNPSNGTIEGTTQTRRAIGVPMNATVPASNYYWAQARGYASVASDAATGAAVGSAMVLSGTVSGAITGSSGTFSSAIPVVAVNTQVTTVPSRNSPVFLTII